MGYSPRDERFLDDFCNYLFSLLKAQDQSTGNAAQAVAAASVALVRMKHAPPSELLSRVLDRLVAICQTPGLQPSPQTIRRFLTACAELSHGLHRAQLKILLGHVCGLHVSEVHFETYCKVAWSLAVLGILDITMLDILLYRLSTKQALLVRGQGIKDTSAQLLETQSRQLYQALEWLRPSPGSVQMEAWSSCI